MTNPRTIQPDARKVIVGVDTHKYVHVAVAIDTWGIRLGDRSCAADSDGYQQLITWAERHGRVAAFGIEGTGSYGAGLARAVRRAGHQVLEVNRGDRRTRRIAALVHDSKLTVNDPNPEASHRPLLYDSGRPSSVSWFRT